MREEGMTLIEVIIVIAILGIVTYISIPRYKTRNYKLHSQAQLLTNDIRKTRYKAMTQGGSPYIVLQENYYVVREKNTANLRVELGQDIWLGENLGSELKFSPNGSPKKGGTITIKDLKTNRCYNITVVPYTGRVLLQLEN